jgi:hypothetical protein
MHWERLYSASHCKRTPFAKLVPYFILDQGNIIISQYRVKKTLAHLQQTVLSEWFLCHENYSQTLSDW